MNIENKIFVRIVIDVLLLISIFILPWWFTVIAAAISIFFFKFFLESVVAALIVDVLYAPSSFVAGFYLITLGMVFIFIFFQIIRKKLIFY